jgi:hypothetical protein
MRTERSSRAVTVAVMAVACIALAALSVGWLVPGDTVWNAEGMFPISDVSDFVASGGLVPAAAPDDAAAPAAPSPIVSHTAAPGVSAIAGPTALTREPAHADVPDPRDPPSGAHAQVE